MSTGYQTYVWKGSNDLTLTEWPIRAQINQMSLGLYHSAFLTSAGEVYCCGQNNHGQLGIGNNDGSYREPVKVACLDEEKTTTVAVGLYHTVCGTASGNIYCWGDSTHSQCCSTEPTLYTTPLCIASFNCPVKKVDCCSTSSVALLCDGRLLAWGSGNVLKYTINNKPQVLELSPFRFIEDRFVLDVSCGADFIVAVLKKTAPTRRCLTTKNSFVIVHKSDSELAAFDREEFTKEVGEKSQCPLGLEVSEEHVLLPSSARSSPSFARKFNSGLHTRSSSVSSKLSHVSSTESLVTSGSGAHSQQSADAHEEGDKSKRADTSLTSLSRQPVINNIDKSEAERWLKDRIGAQFTMNQKFPNHDCRDGEPMPQSQADVPQSNVEKGSPKPAQLTSLARDHLPPYMESMWHSITSSSQAVTSAMQTHIVPKIPYMDRFAANGEGMESSMSESMALVPMLAMQSSPTDQLTEQREEHRPCGTKATASRRRWHNRSRAGSKSNLSEYQSSSCIDTEVWSWGGGEAGQLGHGDSLERLQPSAIACLSDSQVYRVECSHHCCLALSTCGKVYAWGANQHGQIVYKDRSMVVHPTLISISDSKPVIDMSLGVDHILLQVIYPASVRSKCDIFFTGASSHSAMGSRLDFTKRLGHKWCMSAGPNGISSICVQSKPGDVCKSISELCATELLLYRILLDIVTELVEPILDSDYMSSLIDSPYGECLKSMIEELFVLVDKIGLNTQEVCKVKSPEQLQSTSVVGGHDTYLKHFTSYSTHFHNLLAMNGITHLVDTVKIVLLNNDDAITSLLESCQLEFSDDLVVKVSILLQLPLRRVSEYHELIEDIQLHLEDGSMLVSCLTALEQEKVRLSSQYSVAESTRIFWDQCPKAISLALKEPHRRLVRESRSLNLNLVGSSKLYKNVFVLFNDVFVHIQGNVHKVYPLEKLWVEAVVAGDSTHEYEVKLIMPEATLRVEASNSAEKAEWMWMISQTVTAWLSSYKSEPIAASPFPTVLRTTPLVRVASHMFYRAGPLQGAVYKGKWHKGQMHGDGQLTWPDGKVYSGQLTNGELTGYGKMTYKINNSLETMKGHWSKGKLHGFARTRFANGDSYIGFYKDNQFHGHGVLKERSSMSIYVGEWKNGKRQGYGVMDSRGEKYLGQWVKDVRQGAGLHITLDGYYMEGSFTNNKLIGQGLIISSDDTYYEGTFTGVGEVNGKGTMVMNNGDTITGTFDGTWLNGIKVCGVYKKSVHADMSMATTLPKSFGTSSTPHDAKWVELFQHSRVALGCKRDQSLSSADCERAWDKVAVLFANLHSNTLKVKQKRQYSEQLEKIPPHNTDHLSLEQLNVIHDYLCQACESELHPLGLLLKNLVDVYRTSYSGTGTHRRLLIHAREELLSITYRYYQVIRILFPELPVKYSAHKVYSEAALAAQQQQETDGDSAPDSMLLQSETESNTVTPTLLIFPTLLPKIYEPLFHLYALQNESSDDQYWGKVQRFNKQSDMALLSYLGIPRQFWLLQDGNSMDSTPKPLEVKDGCYVEAIETLQRLSTCFTPAEKLHILRLTFDKLNHVVKNSFADSFTWSMDDLFPVFLFVVIRSRLRYLGSEIHFMDDLMDSHLEYGELGLMFTTLKACHLQIQTEKLI